MWRLRAGTAVAEVAPSRGGIVTRFAVGSDEILYLDPKTLIDRTQKVRGGIPVLFPIAGRLQDDRYQAKGRSYPMRQHGLARQARWSVINVEEAHLTMEFRSDAATQASFPYAFSYRLTVDIGRAGYRSLVLESAIENLGDEPMPVHMGLHPYFLVPELDKERCFLELAGHKVYDNVHGEQRVWTGEADLTLPEVDLHFSDITSGQATLHVAGKQPRRLTFTEPYSAVALWTVSLKDFVCVEPWSAPADALNTGVGLITVQPGETRRGEFVISV
jgi:galactose mutarotase-like enzyme